MVAHKLVICVPSDLRIKTSLSYYSMLIGIQTNASNSYSDLHVFISLSSNFLADSLNISSAKSSMHHS